MSQARPQPILPQKQSDMPKGSGRRGGWAYALISPRALQNSAFRPGSGFWGKVGRRESPKGQCLGFPEEDGAQPPGDSLPCCYRSPSGQGGEKGALGEEREAVAQHTAALEWAWGRGLCPAQWEGLGLPGPDSTGAFTRAQASGSCQPLTHRHVDMGAEQGCALAFSEHQHLWRRCPR